MGKSQFSTLRLFKRHVLTGVNISFNSWVGFWGNSCWHEAAPWGPFSQANCTPCRTGIYPRSIQITISSYHLAPSKKENSKRIMQHSCTWNVKKHNIIYVYWIPHNVDAFSCNGFRQHWDLLQQHGMGVTVAKGEHMRTKHQVRFVRTTSNPQSPNRICRVLISFCLPRHSRGPCGLGSLGWQASGLGSWPAVHTKVIIQMWLCQLVDATQRKNVTLSIIWHWPMPISK